MLLPVCCSIAALLGTPRLPLDVWRRTKSREWFYKFKAVIEMFSAAVGTGGGRLTTEDFGVAV